MTEMTERRTEIIVINCWHGEQFTDSQIGTVALQAVRGINPSFNVCVFTVYCRYIIRSQELHSQSESICTILFLSVTQIK